MKFNVSSYKGWNEEGQGQHSTEIVFAVIGEEGAMVWRFATGITPMGPYPSMDRDANLLHKVNMAYPSGMGVSAHSELTIRTASEDEFKINSSCEFLEGRACVCDYSRAIDDDMMKAFACEGFDGVRKLLEHEYKTHYGKDS